MKVLVLFIVTSATLASVASVAEKSEEVVQEVVKQKRRGRREADEWPWLAAYKKKVDPELAKRLTNAAKAVDKFRKRDDGHFKMKPE